MKAGPIGRGDPVAVAGGAGMHQRKPPVNRAVWAVLALLPLALASISPPQADSRGARRAERLDPAVKAVLEQMDAAQKGLETFTAKIVETRHLALLNDPEVLRGTLSFRQPGMIRWEYASPEPRIYVLADGELTGWLPEKKRAEKMKLGRHERRIRRLVAIGQDSAGLAREFKIVAVPSDNGSEFEHLRLTPRSRRVRKQVSQIDLHIDLEKGLPRKIQFETGQGDLVVLELSDVVANPTLADEVFTLNLPEGVEIVEGATSLGMSFGREKSAR